VIVDRGPVALIACVAGPRNVSRSHGRSSDAISRGINR
jgi:hypothetical protein